MHLLEIHDLVVDFKSEDDIIRAVDHISFTMDPGEILGIVGESGSGKSVTALSLLRLIPSPPAIIRSGGIIFSREEKGYRLDAIGEEEMRAIRGREISMIFQEPMTSLNPVYTCGNQVVETLQLHLGMSRKEARNRTLELFREVRLPRPEQIFKAYPHQVSGGQKQRVMIAMAIACNPSMLIADEPTTALDVSVQKTILDLLSGLRKERGMGILFITHDLNLIRGFADKVLVMYRGKIVEWGTTEQVFNDPRHPYTRGLIACRPPLDHRVRRLSTVNDELSMPGPLSIIPRGERETQHRIIYGSEPVITVQQLRKEFTGAGMSLFRRKTSVTVLQNVTMEVFKGETLGIVGESGCGKTTLARVILQLIPAGSGTIRYKGTDITSISAPKLKKLRKELQIVFQDPYSSLNPRISIGSAILEPMAVHNLHGSTRSRKKKVEELLVKVGLSPEHFNRYPHEFSGGQRQRICIARALAVEPDLIILDESVSALDVSIQAQILNLLNDLKKDFGLTYIFISHDLSVVRFMSDRIIVMSAGQIEETGEADEVFMNPKSAYTRQLIAASSYKRN